MSLDYSPAALRQGGRDGARAAILNYATSQQVAHICNYTSKERGREQMAPMAHKLLKSHPQHALEYETEGTQGREQKEIKGGSGGGTQPPPSLVEHRPRAPNPCWGDMLHQPQHP